MQMHIGHCRIIEGMPQPLGNMGAITDFGEEYPVVAAVGAQRHQATLHLRWNLVLNQLRTRHAPANEDWTTGPVR